MSKKTQEPPVKKNAFVHKLYSMLNDPKLSHLIWWTRNEDANTFALYPGKEFANALTGYFKHGNVASFVRQLHMYGFHKVLDPSNENSLKDAPPVWEFKHSSGKFKKDDESSLIYIKRRLSSNSSRNGTTYNEDSNVLIPTSTPSPSAYDAPHYYPQPYVQYYPPYQPHPVPLQYPPMYSYTSAPHQHNMIHHQHQHQHHHPHLHHHPQTNHAPGPPRPSSYGPQLKDDVPLNIPRHNSDPQRHSTPSYQTAPAPSHPPSHQQPIQHYTPNLQFRKIWESLSKQPRPRNPSLLFDPLAPAPPPSHAKPDGPHATGHAKFPPDGSHPRPTPSAGPALAPLHLANPLYSRNDSSSSLGNRDSTSPYASNRDSTSSYASNRDSVDSRLSIKLPPPSSIHRASSSAYPASPSLKSPEDPDAPGSPAKKLSAVPINSSIHERLRPSLLELHFGPSDSQPPSTQSSLPTSILSARYFLGLGVARLQHDSIGSHSSHTNSIFSHNSSLSSALSAQRQSLFGSISHHIAFEPKSSISLGPHDLPVTATGEGEIPTPSVAASAQAIATAPPPSTPSVPSAPPVSALDEKVPIQSPSFHKPASLSAFSSRPKMFRSLTPPNLHTKKQMHSPVPRSLTSIPGHRHSLALNHSSLRSLTNLPLSKNVVKEEPEDDPKEKDNVNKVSVTSLLDDSSDSKRQKTE